MNTEAKLQKAYASAGGRDAKTLPWSSIVQFLMTLFGGACPAKRAKRFAKLFPQATKHMLDDHLKEQGSFDSAKDRSAMVDAAYDTFVAMSADEIDAMR